MIAGAVMVDIGFPASARPVVLFGIALLAVGLCSIGYEVLTETDEEWAHTPAVRGFGRHAPVMG